MVFIVFVKSKWFATAVLVNFLCFVINNARRCFFVVVVEVFLVVEVITWLFLVFYFLFLIACLSVIQIVFLLVAAAVSLDVCCLVLVNAVIVVLAFVGVVVHYCPLPCAFYNRVVSRGYLWGCACCRCCCSAPALRVLIVGVVVLAAVFVVLVFSFLLV